MSQVIENRVVELDFNNTSFEKGVQTSLNTLNQLNKKFDLAGASKNLEDFSKSTTSLNLSPLISAVDNVASKFSTLRMVGIHALMNIVDAAMKAGSTIMSAIATPLNQIKQGGLTRALNLEQATFLLEGLGLDVKQVKEDALFAVKGTAFGFDEAAKVAASFGASGVKAGEDMKRALLGVSGVAAMTGRSYEDIGNIFTTVASNGKLMTMQLRQFSAAGLNVSAALAKSLNKTEEEINDMVSKGQIDFETFSKVMTESFGEHAKKANDTYSGSLSNLNAALSRIGADVQSARLEHMRDIFNSLTVVVDNLHEALGPTIKDINNGMAKAAEKIISFIQLFDRLKVGNNIIDGLRNVFWSLMLVVRPIADAFKEVFPKTFIFSISDAAKRFKEFSTHLTISGETANKIKDIFVKIFTALSKLGDTVKSVVAFIIPSSEKTKNIIEKLGGVIDKLVTKVTGLFNIFSKKKKDGGGIGTSFSKEAKKIEESANKIGIGTDKIKAIIEKFKNFISTTVGGILNPFKKVDGAVNKTASNTKTQVELIQKSIEKVKNVIKNALFSIGNWFKENLAKMDLYDLLTIVESGGFLLFFQKINKEIQVFKKNGGFLTVFNKLINSLTGGAFNNFNTFAQQFSTNFGIIAKSMEENTKVLKKSFAVAVLKNLAISIALLAASFWVLSKIDVKGAAVAFGSITVLISELVAATAILSKVFSGPLNKDFGVAIRSMIEISAAILVLSFAFKNLSKLNWNEFLVGFAGLTVIMSELIIFVKIFSTINSDFSSIKKVSKSLITLGIALNIMALAVRQFANIKNIAQGLISVTIIMAELLIFIKLLSDIDLDSAKGISKIATGLIKIGVALNIMAFAVKQLSSLGVDQLAKGLISIAILLAETFLFMKLLASGDAHQDASIKKASTSLIKVGIALNLMALAVKQLSGLSVGELAKGLISIAVLLGEVVGFSYLMNNIKPSKMIAASTSLILIGAALNIMATAVTDLAGLSLLNTAVALGSITVLLLSIVLVCERLAKMSVMDLMSASIAVVTITSAIKQISEALVSVAQVDVLSIGAAVVALSVLLSVCYVIMRKVASMNPQMTVQGISAIVTLSGALVAMSLAIKLLASADLLGMAVAVGSLSVMLGVLYLAAQGFAKIGNVGVAALSIMGLATALLIMAPAIKMLSTLSVGGAITAIATLAAVLTVFGVAAYALAPVGPILLAIGGAIALVGIGVAAAGVGLLTMAMAMQMVSVVAVAFIQAITRIVVALAPLATVIGNAIASIVVSFANLIAENAGIMVEFAKTVAMSFAEGIAAAVPGIVESAINLVTSFISGIVQKAPDMIRSGIELIKNFLIGIRDNIKDMVQFGIDTVLNFLHGVSEKLPDIIQAGIDLMLSFIEGIADGIANNTDRAIAAFDKLFLAILEAAKKWILHFLDIGKNLMEGLKQGIVNAWEKVKQAVKNVAQGIIDVFKKILRIESPSKEGEDIGMYTDYGVADGVTKYGDVPIGAASDVADGISTELADIDVQGPADAVELMSDNMAGSFEKAGGAAEEFATRYNKGVSDSFTELTLKAKDGSIAIGEYGNKIEPVISRVDELRSRQNDASIAFNNGGMDLKTYTSIMDSTEAEIQELIGDIDKLKEALGFLRVQQARNQKALNELDSAFKAGRINQGEYTAGYNKLIAATQKTNKAIETFGVNVYDTGKKTEEATDKTKEYTKATKGAGGAAKEAGDDISKFGDDLQKTLEGQLKIFDEYKKDDPMNPDQILKNMTDQINGMTNWAANMDKLVAMGIDQGLYQKLAEMGPEGAKYVDAFAQMSAEQMLKANELFAQSIQLPATVKTGLVNNMQTLGQNINQGLANGITGSTGIATAAMEGNDKKVVEQTENDFVTHSPSKLYEQIGYWLMEGLRNGIRERQNEVFHAMKFVCEQVNLIAKNGLDPEKFHAIGYNVTEGLALGMEANVDRLKKAADLIASIPEKTAKLKTKENSPSKVFYEIGKFIDLGLANGIHDYGGRVEESMADTSDFVIDSMRNTISRVASSIQDEIEDPVITPVLDLSNVQRGARTLNSMFSTSQAYAASDSMGGLQNGKSIGGTTFIQNNYSPKALTRADIYRQTRNQFAQYRQATL